MPRKISLLDENGEPITESIDPRLGRRIRDVRRAKNITIKKLAETVGCSATLVTRIELGQRRIDSTTMLVKFSQALQIPTEELITLAGQSVDQISSLVQVAYPGVKTEKQQEVLNTFSKLVTGMNLTDEELDSMLTQATAYAEYCQKNK